MKRFILSLLLALGLATPCLAQGAVLQSGPVVPGRAPVFIYNGVISDSGPASGGQPGRGLSELNMQVQASGTPPFAGAGSGPDGTNLCDYDAPITNATGGHYLCIGPNSLGGGLIEYGAFGAAQALNLQLKINGTVYQLPTGGSAAPLLPGRSIPSGTVDAANTGDTVILWNSSSPSNKTEQLFTCGTLTKTYNVYVVDEFGSAGVNPIVVVPTSPNTILKTTGYAITSAFSSTHFWCDGNGNWVIL